MQPRSTRLGSRVSSTTMRESLFCLIQLHAPVQIMETHSTRYIPERRLIADSNPWLPVPPSSEPITMGNWADLPPDQRPNYQPPASSGPPGVTYAQTGNVQYSPAAFNYTSTPHATQSAPLRTPGSTASSGYQYATAPGNITYTAKPVVQSTPPASVRHTPQTAAPHTMTPTYTTHPQYTAMPQAPPPPPAAPYPPPPMGEHSSSRPEHHRTKSIRDYTRRSSCGRGNSRGAGGPPGGMRPPPSPGLRPGGGREQMGLRMDRLSVSGNRPDLHTIVLEDILEAEDYHLQVHCSKHTTAHISRSVPCLMQ